MNRLTKLKAAPHRKAWILISFVGAMLVGWKLGGNTTWAQTPRPTLTPEPTPTVRPSLTPEPVTEPEAPSVSSGPLLKGRVIDVVTDQPVADVSVVFTTGDVSVEEVTGANGEYAFQHLGAANGVLNVVLPRGSGMIPLTTDVGVRTKTGVSTVVNLGVTSTGSGVSPVIPTVQAEPAFVGAGDRMTITVSVKNALPHAITSATITDWLPDRVVPISIQSSTGNPYLNGGLAVVELGRMDAEGGALAEIVVQVNGGRTSAPALQGTVSFFYKENVASQAGVSGGVNGTLPTVLPLTGVGLPVIGLGLIVVVVLVGWMRRRIGRTSTI